MDSIDALAELVVGDRVRINHYARPRYLQGLCATIIDVDAVTATISLERPVGRFTTGRLRCPPLAPIASAPLQLTLLRSATRCRFHA